MNGQDLWQCSHCLAAFLLSANACNNHHSALFQKKCCFPHSTPSLPIYAIHTLYSEPVGARRFLSMQLDPHLCDNTHLTPITDKPHALFSGFHHIWGQVLPPHDSHSVLDLKHIHAEELGQPLVDVSVIGSSDTTHRGGKGGLFGAVLAS